MPTNRILSVFLILGLVLQIGFYSLKKAEAQTGDAPAIRQSLKNRLGTLKNDEEVSIIIRFREGISAEGRQEIKRLGVVKREFTLIDGVALKVKRPAIDILAKRSDARVIELDLPVHSSLNTSTSQIGSKQVIDSYGLTGKGVKVAVIDTGVSDIHPALAGKVIAHGNFTAESGTDKNGHGTHVAGIIASSDPVFQGNAPAALILDAKVLDGEGNGELSGVISGVEWSVNQGAVVANLSLGAEDFPCDGSDALSETLNTATDRGVAMVVAAGNSGPAANTINIPGCAAKVITVGAVNDYNAVAYFSSRGPGISSETKPNVMAPGVNITSTWYDGSFKSLSGTSQATPHVAGVVALLKELKPSLKPQEIKSALISTGDVMNFSFINTQGQKIINAIAAANVYYGGEKISPSSAGSESSMGSTETASGSGTNSGTGSGTNSDKDSDSDIEVSSTYEEDLDEAREEWISCTREAGSNETQKQYCLSAFLDVQANFQLTRLSSVEIDSLSVLRNSIKQLSDQAASSQNLSSDLKNSLLDVLDWLNEFIFVGKSADSVNSKVVATSQQLTAGILDQDDINALVTAGDREVLASRNEKYARALDPFRDVDDIHWFFTFVEDIKEKDCVSGYETEDGTETGDFGPANSLTVAESLKIILECSGKADSTEPSEAEPETEAASNHWAKQYYLQAESLGLTIASNPEDDPNRPITRAEFVQEILETLEIPLVTEFEAIFSDVPKDHPYASFIYTAYQKSIISGDSAQNKFRPDSAINRAEMSKVVLQALNVQPTAE